MTLEALTRQRLAQWRTTVAEGSPIRDAGLSTTLERWLGGERLAELLAALEAFERTVAGVVERAAATGERHPPRLVSFDAIGRHVESIEFHPDHHAAGRAIWAAGMLACQRDGDGAFEQATLFYLLAHAGEGGHACPVACTAGLARALQRHGSQELRDRYLPGLVDDDYGRATRAAQFVTEIHSGSDVGANTTRARPDAVVQGGWRISGEKWFCSVADADLFAVLARPEGAPAGTRGLGCFLVPRRLENGSPNGFRIRRLKDKFGTRAMATAEIEFADALGFAIGPLEGGFHVAVEELLNTSRWLNALGSAALVHRAQAEALAFAHHRTAFGHSIDRFPMVRETLATIIVEARASLASSLEVTGLRDLLDHGSASDQEAACHRLLVNANKYVTSIGATSAIHRAIEVLGGNGTIEDFSPLPRLYRDAIVFESWEGTHNVLCEQVRRDCASLGILDALLARLHAQLAEVTGGALGEDRALVAGALQRLAPRLEASIADERVGTLHIRRQVHILMRAAQAVYLLRDAQSATDAEEASRIAAIAAAHIRRHLVVGYEADTDPEHLERIDRIVADVVSPSPRGR